MSHTEKPEECASCNWETTELHEVEDARQMNGPFDPDTKYCWLCKVCYSTLAGNVYHYPEQYPGQHAIASTIAWGINYLASLITENKPEP